MTEQERFVDSLRADLKMVAESVIIEVLRADASSETSKAVRMAVLRSLHAAYFNFLAVLDGSHPLQFEGDETPFDYELWATAATKRFRINDPEMDELTSFWNNDEWLGEVYGNEAG